MLIKLVKKKLSGNFIFDGILLMFVNIILMFAFGVIFGLMLLWGFVLNKQLPVSPNVFVVLFGLVSIYVWFMFGNALSEVLKTNRLLKVLIINLIGAAPIVLVLIYQNLLIGFRETRISNSCVGGLLVFSLLAAGSIFFQIVSLMGGVLWRSELKK